MSTATIFVDGRPHSIEGAETKNLLEACLSLGLDLPYFCWHPAMHSVGACRQCAVKLFKDEADTRGRIVMACMTPVVDGLRASIEDPEAKAFRAGIIEWLMVNHPHDCPICDEGGECHLQDMTVMTGHVRRRYRFDKREHRSQDLGPFIAHEMNRCIQCYRCVRFYRDYAGGEDLDVRGWHDSVYFGRVEDGTLESPFSGNLCEVCPTGVFTDKTQAAHPTRKWDLHTSPSVCPNCGLGCSTLPAERYGELRRVRPRYNADVNGYFICDRGRFGQAFADSPARLVECLIRGPSGGPRGQAAAPPDAAVDAARAALAAGGAVGIGSPRASIETNFALRALVGPDRFFLAVPDEEYELYSRMRRVLAAAGRRAASPRDAEASDAVLVLGEDVWNDAPILALRLRQASRNAPNQAAMREKRIPAWDDAALREAVQDRPGPFFIASPEPSPLDASAEVSYRAAPDDIARLGYAVAAIVDPTVSAPEDMGEAPALLARRIASALMRAKRPLVVSGSGLGSAAVVSAAAAVLSALLSANQDARIALVFPEANSLGAAMLAAGGLESAGRALAAGAIEGGGSPTLVVAEADLSRASLGQASLGRASERGSPGLDIMSKAGVSIVIDHCESATTRAADIVLPASTILEGSGTFVSSEGRAQRYFALREGAGPVRDGWRWLDALSTARDGEGPGGSSRSRNLDDIDAAIARELPVLASLTRAAPASSFRLVDRRIARGANRESGRTAMHANVDPREPDPATDPDSALSYSMEGPRSAPPSLLPRYWAAGWNSDQSLNKFQMEVGGPLRGGEIGARVFDTDIDRDALRDAARGAGYGTAIPSAFAKRADALLVLPRRHIFGSEELSARSQAIASRIPETRLHLSIPDAGRLGLADGTLAEIGFSPSRTDAGLGKAAASLILPIAVTDLPEGVASLPWGLPDLPGSPLAFWAAVRPATRESP
jgi:NADH-quinone oxidoreductase subunit G